jgi:TonB family protein
MVDLRGHETGNGGYSQRKPTAHRDSSTRKVAIRPDSVTCPSADVLRFQIDPAQTYYCPFPELDFMTSSRRALFLAFTLTLLTSATFASKQEAEAAALIAHAKQLSDIRAEGAAPFRLKLDFKIIKDDGAVMDGTYTELWVSKTQWRRETVLGDFRRIQIGAGRKVWLVDSSTVVPQQIEDIPHISDLGRLRPEVWKSRKDREVNGTGVHCLDNNLKPLSATWALCFDKVSGMLNAEISPLHLGAGSGERVCLHSDYQKFGEYMVARSYECDEDKHPKIEARVVELAADPAQDPTLFVPPEGAKESVNCLGSVKPPKQVYAPGPTPPRHFSGSTMVMMSINVGIDGTPRNLKVTSAPNHDYDEAAQEAVRKWRFTPATCDGEPMETQIALEIEFHHF